MEDFAVFLIQNQIRVLKKKPSDAACEGGGTSR